MMIVDPETRAMARLEITAAEELNAAIRGRIVDILVQLKEFITPQKFKAAEEIRMRLTSWETVIRSHTERIQLEYTAAQPKLMELVLEELLMLDGVTGNKELTEVIESGLKPLGELNPKLEEEKALMWLKDELVKKLQKSELEGEEKRKLTEIVNKKLGVELIAEDDWT